MTRMRQTITVLAFVSILLIPGCPPPDQLQAGDTRTFDGIPFQWCPPGTFVMGSPGSEEGRRTNERLHEVTITEGFWLSTYEITQAQWKEIFDVNPSEFVGNNLPVETVTWDDAQDFIVLMNASADGNPYRLPTDAEWEYACRAGTQSRFYWGKDADEEDIYDYAWFVLNAHSETNPVGDKLPNAWGLYDMSGNVYEWCDDFYEANLGNDPATDPQGPGTGPGHVIRSGSWFYGPEYCRSAYRSYQLDDVGNGAIGFRLLREQN